MNILWQKTVPGAGACFGCLLLRWVNLEAAFILIRVSLSMITLWTLWLYGVRPPGNIARMYTFASRLSPLMGRVKSMAAGSPKRYELSARLGRSLEQGLEVGKLSISVNLTRTRSSTLELRFWVDFV